MVKNPFKQENISENKFIRIFDENIPQEELVWHKDRNDRLVKVIKNENWKLQLDNQLPKLIETNDFIPKETYHRLIKGKSELIVEITEY